MTSLIEEIETFLSTTTDEMSPLDDVEHRLLCNTLRLAVEEGGDGGLAALANPHGEGLELAAWLLMSMRHLWVTACVLRGVAILVLPEPEGEIGLGLVVGRWANRWDDAHSATYNGRNWLVIEF